MGLFKKVNKTSKVSQATGMDKFIVRTTAKSIYKQTVFFKAVTVVAAASVSILSISYGMSTFVEEGESFTVEIIDINEEDTKLRAISITEDGIFDDPLTNEYLGTTYLAAESVDSMDNITKSWLPDNLHEQNGSNNGDDYIAYSFYLKNVGNVELDYSRQINISEVTKNTDSAVRVMTILNGEEQVYAKASDITGLAEADAEMFYSNTIVFNETRENLNPGEIDKYTVVIWLEGNDPECIDNILGGKLKMNMDLKVLDA